jgi:TetR/AcrR family transcriptional repressor of nem operon
METKSTRDRLIAVGLKLMHGHGYGATGISEILDSAAIPKGSFYHHFGSKEDFAAAVLESYASREMQRWESTLNNRKLSPLRRLRRYFDELVKVYGQKGPIPGCLMGSLSLEVASQSDLLQQLLSASFGYWQRAISTTLREAVDAKELAPSTEPDSLASFLLNNWQGAVLRSLAERSNEPLRYFLRYTFDVLLIR